MQVKWRKVKWRMKLKTLNAIKNRTQNKILSLAVLLVLVLLIVFSVFYFKKSRDRAVVKFDSIQVNAEIANSPLEQARGLMFRESLALNSGMLFVFDREQLVSFWMLNTKIPLDLIFISESLEIVDIKENFQPCDAQPCEVYTSRRPAKYVLEVNAGFVDENSVGVGDKVALR